MGALVWLEASQLPNGGVVASTNCSRQLRTSWRKPPSPDELNQPGTTPPHWPAGVSVAFLKCIFF